jgi:hypothetical protein
MATLYSTVEEKFVYKIEDSVLIALVLADRQDMTDNYRESAEVEFKKCPKLSSKDDVAREYTEELTTEEIEILAYGMVLAWVTPKVNSLDNLKQKMSTKDYKIYSQANQLDKMINLKSESERKVSIMINSYTYTENIVDFENWRDR